MIAGAESINRLLECVMISHVYRIASDTADVPGNIVICKNIGITCRYLLALADTTIRRLRFGPEQ